MAQLTIKVESVPTSARLSDVKPREIFIGYYQQEPWMRLDSTSGWNAVNLIRGELRLFDNNHPVYLTESAELTIKKKS